MAPDDPDRQDRFRETPDDPSPAPVLAGDPQRREEVTLLGRFSFGLREAVMVAVVTTGFLLWLS